MSLTTDELKQKVLRDFDPDDIIESLEITSEQLLDAFEDRLIAKAFKFLEFDEED